VRPVWPNRHRHREHERATAIEAWIGHNVESDCIKGLHYFRAGRPRSNLLGAGSGVAELETVQARQ
jgi:hypothetical protein